jgi:hypothetical protein
MRVAALASPLIPIIGVALYVWQNTVLEVGVLPLAVLAVAAGPIGFVVGLIAVRGTQARTYKIVAAAGMTLGALLTIAWIGLFLTFEPG